jgi:hypothetical protein
MDAETADAAPSGGGGMGHARTEHSAGTQRAHYAGPQTPLLACLCEEITDGPKLELVQALCEAGAPATHVRSAIKKAEALFALREACLQQSIADVDQVEYIFGDRVALQEAQNILDYLRARKPAGSPDG